MKQIYFQRIITNTLAITCMFFIVFSFGDIVSAQPNNIRGGLVFENPLGANATLQGFLKSILRVVTMLGAIVVVFFIIFAGFNYVTARGDEKKIQAATKTFTWTAVGAAVILGAQVIANAIEGTVRQLGTGSN